MFAFETLLASSPLPLVPSLSAQGRNGDSGDTPCHFCLIKKQELIGDVKMQMAGPSGMSPGDEDGVTGHSGHNP